MLEGAVVGDGGDSRVWTLTGVQDLAGATTIEADFRIGTTVVTVPCAVNDVLTCKIDVPVGDFLTDPNCAAGDWLTETVLDRGMPTRLTIPNGSPDILPVRAPNQ